MKPTLKNYIKLRWHCFIRSHQSASLSDDEKMIAIWCHTCKPDIYDKFGEIKSKERKEVNT